MENKLNEFDRLARIPVPRPPLGSLASARESLAQLSPTTTEHNDADQKVDAKPKPYRNRAEMYAMKDGKIFGGIYDNGSFGVFGGGIDPGEDITEAAAREFQEETGWAVNNAKILPFDPHTIDWKPPFSTPKQAERAKKFRGSRTYYVIGDLGDQIPDAVVDELGRKDIRLYDIAEAQKLALAEKATEPAIIEANKKRLEILKYLAKQHTPAAVLPITKRAESEVFTVACDLDGTLAKKEVPFDPLSIGKPRKNALKAMTAFREAGARLIIFTVRGNTELVKAWLAQHKIPYDYINENPDQPEDGSGKVIADLYWDDRAVNAEDDDSWEEVLALIEAAKPVSKE